jgi:hypothetical protein
MYNGSIQVTNKEKQSMKIQDQTTAALIAGEHFSEMDKFQMFNLDGMRKHLGRGAFGKPVLGDKLPDDVWHFRKHKPDSNKVLLEDQNVSMVHADKTPEARRKRVADLEKLYAVLIPLERSAFPEPVECEDEFK